MPKGWSVIPLFSSLLSKNITYQVSFTKLEQKFRMKSVAFPAFRLGPVCRGQFGEVLSFFTTDRPHYHRMPPLSGDNHGWVVSAVRTGCALGHRATTIRACAHLMKTAARYQLRAQGRSFVPGPNKFGGISGRSPGERPHYGIAGESPGKRDLMWTQGL